MLGLLLNPITLVGFGLMLGILIFVHELGHFMVAKRLGISVLEFGFGFPPRAVRFWKSRGWIELQGRRIIIPNDFQLPEKLQFGSRVLYKTNKDDRGRQLLTGLELVDAESQGLTVSSQVQAFDPGTEYTLNWIPLGGFVRMAGEDDPAVRGGFQNAKPWVRAAILLAGVTMNFILAYFIFSALAVMTPQSAQIQTTRISIVVPESPAALAGLTKGDTIASINGQDVLNDFTALSKTLSDNAGKPVTLNIMRNGSTVPLTIIPRVTPPPGEGRLGIGLDGLVGLRVMAVEPGSIAESAGVRAGDILAFIVDPKQSRTLKDEDELAQFSQTHAGFKIEWHVARNGKLIQPDPLVVQIPETVTAQNATLGLSLRVSLAQAPLEGANTMGQVIAAVPMMFAQIARAGVPDNAFVGPVGILQITGEVSQRFGLVGLLVILGQMSLSLAIFNLFPFPPLDGGHLAFVFLEWIRGGKRMDVRKQRLISEIGIVVLLGFFLIVTFSDVQRMFAGRFILPPTP